MTYWITPPHTCHTITNILFKKNDKYFRRIMITYIFDETFEISKEEFLASRKYLIKQNI